MMDSSLLLVLSVVAVTVALVTIVLAVSAGASTPTGVARSLAIIERSVDAREVGKHDLPVMDRLVYPLLSGTKALGHRLSPDGTAERIARRLDFAGNPEKWTPERVLGAKGTGLVVGALVGFVLGGFGVRGLMFGGVGAVAGFFLPDLLVYNLSLKRQEELRRGLADALDMLTVCVEAGQGFDAALMQVARAAEGPIAGEFARVLAEIQMGKSRSEAFGSLGSRTTVAEAKTFVSALVQADRLGIPIGNVLREQSQQMRVKRRQRAEEIAQKVPVKILFPLILFIFPALFIVIIGPGAIRIADVFTGGGL